jgi:hypothetical protein
MLEIKGLTRVFVLQSRWDLEYSTVYAHFLESSVSIWFREEDAAPHGGRILGGWGQSSASRVWLGFCGPAGKHLMRFDIGQVGLEGGVDHYQAAMAVISKGDGGRPLQWNVLHVRRVVRG